MYKVFYDTMDLLGVSKAEAKTLCSRDAQHSRQLR
jgi:hypothetical protein